MGGSLLYEEIEAIYVLFPQYREILKNFIESGTYKGDTSRMAAEHFDMVYTVEINEELHNKSKEASQNYDNIMFILGDSVIQLNKLLPLITEPSLYFIDAHISGSDSSYNGKQLVPLYEELCIILRHIRNRILKGGVASNIFIIDDARFWLPAAMGENESSPHDWAHITLEEILNIFNRYNVPVLDHYLENDRYIILT